ncbi:MAG TPA: hypothetical protein VFK89_09025 [Actinomycetota bacterium]|nr:hypothetical protein [Actinomycetota bacterium]
MRKVLAVIAALGVVVALAAPASAAKKTKVHETFGAPLAPFPNYSSLTSTARPGCSAGQEGVHWVGQEFTAPGKGTLKFHAEGFTGDWDLYVFTDGSDVPIARSENDQTQGGAAPEEEILLPMKAKQTVTLVACNWLGDPNVSATYEGTFSR